MRQLADELAGQGWATSRELFSPEVVAVLRSAWEKARQDGRFHAAAIGAGRVDKAVRGDEIAWLDEARDGDAYRKYAANLDALLQTLSRELRVSLNRWEAHFASYAPGSFYQRHRDQHTGSDARKISTVLYLNEDWRPGDGGELVLYTAEGERILSPEAGLFVCFLSGELEHEVRPTRRERRSVTGWIRHDTSALGAGLG